ncbi:MAG: Smr/MutS family protein [Pseudomonadota bacterium]|nr:Smr/MutS family protein [Pseudomonadota bacterium]
MKKKNTEDDLKTWSEYLKDPKDIFDKDRFSKKIIFKKKFKFDLHGFTLEDANKKVKEIIKDCYNKGIEEILLITGKGKHSNNNDVFSSKELSKLRYSIPDYLNNNIEISKLIRTIKKAPEKDGGSGALIIKLKKL